MADETLNVSGRHLGIGDVVNLPGDAEAAQEVLNKTRSTWRREENSGDSVVVFNGPVNAAGSHFGTGNIVNNNQ